jgi:uncharacterized protein
MRWTENKIFLCNYIGEYTFLEEKQFESFVSKELQKDTNVYKELKSKHFLYDSAPKIPLELLAIKFRTKMDFLEGFTKLHLFIVTLRCDHRCHYCAASSVSIDSVGYDMDMDTAKRAVDIMASCPSTSLKVEFQGGEPLLNFDTVRFICDYCNNNLSTTKQIEYVICTNLASLDREKLEYIKNNNIFISTSFDGPRFIHDANRQCRGGSSYDICIERIRYVMEELGKEYISALMTASDISLNYPKEIIDEYVKIGLTTIFLRSVRPYGRSRTVDSQYSSEEYLEFYNKALDYIIALNRKGVHIIEGFAQILLTKILTPFATGYVDIQSPAGAGIGFVAYNFDGKVYASDEARMLAYNNDNTFYMGNVFSNSFKEIFYGQTIRALVENSCVATLPECSECAFQIYCGADPIHNYATQGDIIGHRPTSDFCKKNKAIIKLLIDYYQKGDEFIRDLFLSWIAPHKG